MDTRHQGRCQRQTYYPTFPRLVSIGGWKRSATHGAASGHSAYPLRFGSLLASTLGPSAIVGSRPGS